MASFLPALFNIGSQLIGTVLGNKSSGQSTTNQTVETGTGQQTNMTGKVNQTSTTGVNQTQTSNQSSTQNTSQTGSQNTTQSGTSNTSQQSSQQGTTQSSEQQQGTTTGVLSRLDNDTLAQLTEGVRGLLGGVAGTQSALQQNLSEVSARASDFDPAAFVSGIMKQAGAVAGLDLESGLNATASRIGAGSSSNSAAALLDNRLRNTTAANMAGIGSQAVATAEGIVSQNQQAKTSALTALSDASNQNLSALIGSLLGATQTESQTSQQSATGTQQTAQTGTQTGQEQTSQQSGTTSQQNTATTGTTTGKTTSNSTTTENTSQTQETNQNVAQTSKEVTKGTTTAGKQDNNWSDFFSNLGKAFTTSFDTT